MSKSQIFVNQVLTKEVKSLVSKKKSYVNYLAQTLGIDQTTAKTLGGVIRSSEGVTCVLLEGGLVRPFTTHQPSLEAKYGAVPVPVYSTPTPPTLNESCKEVQTTNQKIKIAKAEQLDMLDKLTPEKAEVYDYKIEVSKNKTLTDQEQIEWDKHGYVFVKPTNTYLVRLKSMANQWVNMKAWQHEALLSAYSNWKGEGETIEAICMKFGLNRQAFDEYKKIFKWTHDSLPLTKEKLQTESVDTLVQDLVTKKKFEVTQAYNKRAWEETQQNAKKWEEFVAMQVDPFEHVINRIKVEPITPISQYQTNKKALKRDCSMLIGLSDIHFGAKADPTELVYGGYNNIKETERRVDDYALKIKEIVLHLFKEISMSKMPR